MFKKLQIEPKNVKFASDGQKYFQTHKCPFRYYDTLDTLNCKNAIDNAVEKNLLEKTHWTLST